MQEKGEKTDKIKARIIQYLDFKKIKKVDFYKETGLNSSNFKGAALRSELGSGKIAMILSAYPDINPNWLLTGKGDVFQSNNKPNKIQKTFKSNACQPVSLDITEIKESDFIYNSHGNKYRQLEDGSYIIKTPVVSVDAYARYLTDFQEMEKDGMVELQNFTWIALEKGGICLFKIKGDSMDDDSKRSIPDKSMVLTRELEKEHWKSPLHIKKFPFWIIVTEGCVLCKQIIKHDKRTNTITCRSLNSSPEYSDFELRLSEVRQLLNIIKVQYNVDYE